MANCQNCKRPVQQEDLFCRSCGVKLEIIDEISLSETEEAVEEVQIQTVEPEHKGGKIIAITLAALIIVFTLVFITWFKSSSYKSSGAQGSKYFVKSGNWIYHTISTNNQINNKNEYGIFKLSDSGEKVKLYDDMALSLVIKDNFIYYSSLNDKGKIYRMGTDGSERQLVSEDVTQNLAIKDDYLIYNAVDDSRSLFRINLKDNSKVKICDDILNFCISGDTIYYSSAESLGKVFRVSLDGSDKKELFSIEGPILYANDNYIYFADTGIRNDAVNNANRYLFSNNGGKIYRINIDGSNRKLIIPTEAYNFHIWGNHYYYQSINKGTIELYEMDFKGKDNKKIASNINLLDVVDEWIYYIDRGDGVLYRININDHKKEKLN